MALGQNLGPSSRMAPGGAVLCQLCQCQLTRTAARLPPLVLHVHPVASPNPPFRRKRAPIVPLCPEGDDCSSDRMPRVHLATLRKYLLSGRCLRSHPCLLPSSQTRRNATAACPPNGLHTDPR